MLQNSMIHGQSYPSQGSILPKAPTLLVETRMFSGIEHPFIIRDVDKCVKSLGGPHKLRDLVKSPSDVKSQLYYRPGDRMTEPLQSSNVQTKDLLLKVTVPKRTGLKRKRGSATPYAVGDDGLLPLASNAQNRLLPESNARRFVRSLAENPGRCQINVLGTIERTHRFRGMPDFALSTANDSFIKKMREHILPFDYEKMKSFEFDMSKGAQPNTAIIPPPNWSHYEMPFNFAYHQNPSVRHFVDQQGNFSTINIHASQKALGQAVSYEVAEVPTGPSSQLPPLDTLEPRIQQLVAEAKTVIETRPIFTRRALQNSLSQELWHKIGTNSAKIVFHYVGYVFNSGPWRDAIVKFGVDPRTDPKYRIYQTIMLIDKIPHRESRFKTSGPTISKFEMEPVPSEESHLFNGKTYSKDCKEWQVCDISDPIISRILSTENLRPECQLDCGWYFNGTWAKVKVLTKCKMIDLSLGLGLVPTAALADSNRTYERLADRVPDIITRKDFFNDLRENASSDESRLLSVIRSSALMGRRSIGRRSRMADEDEDGDGDGDGMDAQAMEIEGGGDEVMDEDEDGDEDEGGDQQEDEEDEEEEEEKEEEEEGGIGMDLIDPDLENGAAVSNNDNDEESQDVDDDGESVDSEPRD